MHQKALHISSFCLALSLQVGLSALFSSANASQSAAWSLDFAAGENELADQKLPEAEESFRKALTEVKAVHHQTEDEANCMNKLADTLALRSRAAEAQELYKKSLGLLEARYGKDSAKIVPALFRLGSMYESEGDPSTAMALYQRAIHINEKNYGPYSPAVANSLHRLAKANFGAGQKNQAVKHYKEALSILMQQPGLTASNQMQSLLSDYQDLLKKNDNSNKDLVADFKQDILQPSSNAPGSAFAAASSVNAPASLGNLSLNPISKQKTNFDFELAMRNTSPNSSSRTNKSVISEPPFPGAVARDADMQSPKLRPAHSLAEDMREHPKMSTASIIRLEAPQLIDEPTAPLSSPLAQTTDAATLVKDSSWRSQSAFQLNVSKQAQTNQDPQVLKRGLGQPFTQTELSPMYKALDDVLYKQNHYQDSELVYQRKVAIDLKALGPTHPSVGNDLNSLALLYVSQSRYKEAEPLLMRAMKIYEDAYGDTNLLSIKAQATLASVEYYLGNVEQAAQLYRSALGNGIETLSPKDLQTARILNELAFLYYQQGKLQEAATFYQWALASTQGAVGENDPLLAACMKDYAQLLRALGRPSEATAFDVKADDILAQR